MCDLFFPFLKDCRTFSLSPWFWNFTICLTVDLFPFFILDVWHIASKVLHFMPLISGKFSWIISSLHSFCFCFQNFCYLDIAFPDPLIFIYFPIFNIIIPLQSRKFCWFYFANSFIQFFICYLLIFKNFHLFCECSFLKK